MQSKKRNWEAISDNNNGSTEHLTAVEMVEHVESLIEQDHFHRESKKQKIKHQTLLSNASAEEYHVVIFTSDIWYIIASYLIDTLSACQKLATVCKGVLHKTLLVCSY